MTLIARGRHYIVASTSTHDPGQNLDVSIFRAWSLDCTENSALTIDYSTLATPIKCLETFWSFLYKLAWAVCLTTWPAPKFRLHDLTSLWPRSRVGVQSSMQCHPLDGVQWKFGSKQWTPRNGRDALKLVGVVDEVGVIAKVFARVSRAHCRARSYVNSWIRPWEVPLTSRENLIALIIATVSILYRLTMASFSSGFLLSRHRLSGGVVAVPNFFGDSTNRLWYTLGHFFNSLERRLSSLERQRQWCARRQRVSELIRSVLSRDSVLRCKNIGYGGN